MIKKILFVLAVSAIALPAMAQDYYGARPAATKKVGDVRALNAVREDAKEKINALRETAKERLLKINDEKKRNAVERIEKELARLNAHMSDVFSHAVSQIDGVLKRVEARVEKAKNSGRDVATVLPLIDVAHKAVVAAQTAIKMQALKTYTITNPNDQTLRVDAQKLKQLLKSDLNLVRDLVKTVRTAVHNVAVALAQVAELKNKPKNDKIN